jgi:virginiamycin A acetyltransferase
MRSIFKTLAKLREQLDNINSIGQGVQLGRDCYIKGSTLAGKVSIGDGCRLNNVLIRGDVKIGRYTSVWGPNTDILSGVHGITIGNFCSIARNVSFQEYNHDLERFTTYFITQNLLKQNKMSEIVSKGAITVGHDVWIGTHCVILSGANIGTGAVIAANSVVSGDIPPYAVAGGTPAKVIKYRFDEATRQQLLELAWWDWEVEKIKSEIGRLEALKTRANNE